MKKMKAMYRKHTILARNISIAVLGRKPVPEILIGKSARRKTLALAVPASQRAELKR
jgi:hypothetical protein